MARDGVHGRALRDRFAAHRARVVRLPPHPPRFEGAASDGTNRLGEVTVQRRTVLRRSAAVLAPLAQHVRARTVDDPPVARVDGVVDRRLGLDLPDPYRWMENPNDPDWEPFMRGQAAYARAQLDALPLRDQIGCRVAALSASTPAVNQVQRAGARTFVEYRPAGATGFKLYVVDDPGRARRLLYDPERETGRSGSRRSLDYWVASPDGRYVAFGSSLRGSEDSTLRVLRTDDGSLLPEELDRAQYGRVAWLPDSSGFFLSRLRDDAVRGQAHYHDKSAVWLHPQHGDPRDDQRIVGSGDIVDGYAIPASDFPAVMTEPGSKWALLQAAGAVRRHNPVLCARLDDLRSGSGRWRCILTVEGEVTNIALRGQFAAGCEPGTASHRTDDSRNAHGCCSGRQLFRADKRRASGRAPRRQRRQSRRATDAVRGWRSRAVRQYAGSTCTVGVAVRELSSNAMRYAR